MKKRIETIKRVKYRGHGIRLVQDVWGQQFVVVDNSSDEVETAPAHMQPQDHTYASIADAKRIIRGDVPKYVTSEADVLGLQYFNRFAKVFPCLLHNKQ